ncbi:MAG: DUF3352 domain-containing protein [Chloroflexi bacterium]|nr:MAG: DUF3352 domain-containing protein [Chloroflexota bacterium]
MKRGFWLIGGGILLVLFLVGGMLWLDPWGWRLLDRLNGRFDATLSIAPPDAFFYAGIDLLQADRDRLTDLWDTFSQAAVAEDGVNQLTEMDISLDEDVLPWVGQYVGLVGLETTPTHIQWVLAVEVRDRQAADAFAQKLKDRLASVTGETAVSNTVAGHSMWRLSDGRLFGRADNLFFFASDETALQTALETREGESLAQNPDYIATISQLPPDRSATIFFSGEQISTTLAELIAPFVPARPENLPTQAIRGTAVALIPTEFGIRLTGVTLFDSSQMAPWQQEAISLQADGTKLVNWFPADAVAFAGGQGVHFLWQAYRDTLIAEIGEADFSASMDAFARQYSLNPDTELFPYLTGAAGAVLLPSVSGAFWGGVNGGLDVLALVETADADTLAANLAQLSANIGDPITGLGTLTETAVSDGTRYTFTTILLPDWRIGYGTENGRFLLAINAEALDKLPETQTQSLAANRGLQGAWGQLSPEITPGFYVNFDELRPYLRQGGIDLPGWLTPITAVAGGSQPETDGIRHELVILIHTDTQN